MPHTLIVLTCVIAAAPRLSFEVQEIDRSLKVGYAVRIVDINRDKRKDIVVVDAHRVIWFENPSWEIRTMIEGQTKPDNVCMAPLDIDGDGRIDLALGADWRPFDTKTGGTIQWLRQPDRLDQPWTLHAIGQEPTVHRMNWIDLKGDGHPELVVAPLMGQGTTKPDFAERGVRVLAFAIPARPDRERWYPRVIDQSLHVTHNFTSADLDRDGRTDLVLASFEGVTWLRNTGDRWVPNRIGAGNQETRPNRGASEIKVGRRGTGAPYLATIEPWHGNQVVIYDPPTEPSAPWNRRVLDERLQWGHAVWCANLDGDADEELVIGVRDDLDDSGRRGVRVYDPTDDWSATLIDAGGVAVEDLAGDDLDGDGQVDLVAVGRQTGNVRIYWNRSKPR